MMENLNNYIEGAPVKVHIDNVVKKFNGRNGEMVALNGVTLDIHDNEFICVVGPSGCGKSTLLNIIAGLLESTSGRSTATASWSPAPARSAASSSSSTPSSPG